MDVDGRPQSDGLCAVQAELFRQAVLYGSVAHENVNMRRCTTVRRGVFFSVPT